MVDGGHGALVIIIKITPWSPRKNDPGLSVKISGEKQDKQKQHAWMNSQGGRAHFSERTAARCIGRVGGISHGVERVCVSRIISFPVFDQVVNGVFQLPIGRNCAIILEKIEKLDKRDEDGE